MAELTPEQKSKGYSKYYFEIPASPAAEAVQAMTAPIDSALAMLPEDLNLLLAPGYQPVEQGWCVLENGAAYVANRTFMPGVTVEMIRWWFAWHALGDIRYMIWYPPCHFGIAVSEQDRARILNPGISMEEKHYNVNHIVQEDVGGPNSGEIQIHFLPPESMGLDVKLNGLAPDDFSIIGGFGTEKSTGGNSIMLHYARAVDGGLEFRSRFWLGYKFENNKPKLVLPPGLSLPDVAPKGLAGHNIAEYANLARLLPRIYPEEGSKPLDY